MPDRDFYNVLGVGKSASEDEIRRAFRKLARELHPDVNRAPDAAKKFAEVQRAYEALSDPQKRAMYDTYGTTEPGAAAAGGRSGPGRGGTGRGGPFHWTGGAGGGRGSPFETEDEDLSSVFDAIFGGAGGVGGADAGTGRGRRAGGRRAKPVAPEEPLQHEIRVPFLTAARGGTEHLRISEGERTRTIEVKIPAGINDGAQLRVRGAGSTRQSAADLLLTVRVERHPLFRRGETADTGRGLDLYLDAPVTIAEAILGGNLAVPTLDKPVEVRLPPGTSSGRKLRLRGKGIHEIGPASESKAGDLYVVIQIVAPDGSELSEAERRMLTEVSSRSGRPRSGGGWPEHA